MYEEHFAVLGQGPELIVDDEFEVVDVVAYLLDEWCYGVVIGDGSFAAVLDAIGDSTGFDEPFAVLGYSMGVISVVEILKRILADPAMKPPKTW